MEVKAMFISDTLDMQGRLTLQQRNAADEILAEIEANNSIVLSGRDLVAKMFINEPITPISHVAVGTGNLAVNPASDTGLQAELFRKPINPIDPSQHLTTTGDNKKKVTITAELDFSEANGALTEAGLFNAESDGVMYNRVVFPPINKTTDFKLTLIWEVLF
jgi:hypothetical protein